MPTSEATAKMIAAFFKFDPESSRDERMRIRGREAKHRQRAARKVRFLKMYGMVCECCGESNPKFLTLDHINGKGERNKATTQAALRDAVLHFDPKKYRTLCFNCNCGRHWNGGVCPHKDLKL